MGRASFDVPRIALSNLVTFSKGKKPKLLGHRNEMLTTPYINIRAFERNEAIEYCDPTGLPTCEPDDILVVWDGARCGLVGRGAQGVVGSTLMRLKAERVDSAYLFYFLQTQFGALNTNPKGMGIPHVDPTRFWTLQVPIPPVDEQKRTVTEIQKQFTRLDAGVALLRQVQTALKRYRASVLKAACEGRVVPTEAELAGKENRSYETGEELLHRILKERIKNWQGRGKYKEPDAPEIAKLPELPNGWTWLTVETIGFVTKLAGFEYTKYVKYSPDGDLAVIKAENAGRSGFKRTEISRIKSSTVAQLTRSQLKAGDLLMVFVGAGTGNVARVPDDQRYFLGPNIAMIRVEPRYASAAYVEIFLRSPVGHSLTFTFIKAVAQPSLSMGTIRRIPVALPPLAEQTRIVAEVERRLSVAEELEGVVSANLQRGIRLRQSILQHAFYHNPDSNEEVGHSVSII
jgi:type I restriction enzyme S subunit